MRDDWIPKSAESYSNYLFNLREERKEFNAKHRKSRPLISGLTKTQRQTILNKTNSRCHLCGGKIQGKWQADHVFSYSKGGKHTEDNYLPAHPACNNYRRDYDPAEFLEIIKLGIWMRTQIVKKTNVGMDATEKFIKHEISRDSRRKRSD